MIIPENLRRIPLFVCFALFACVVNAASEKPLIIVTTSLISSAVHDVSGDLFEVKTLMPAGTCPSDFDLAPQQVGILAQASLVFRHERQLFLDRIFIAAGVPAARIIVPAGNFTIPDHYAEYCALVAKALIQLVPEHSRQIKSNLEQLQKRMEKLEVDIKFRTQDLSGMPVVCALFQEELVKYLGLRVVASIPPTEDPSPGQISSVLKDSEGREAFCVIANQQNGERFPRLIAEQLKTKLLVLSNFPVKGEAGAQERLIRENVEKLIVATNE